MDPARFDSLTRSAANRREVVTKLGVGGLAAALAAGLGVRSSEAQAATCSLDLQAYVRLGPSAGVPLVPTATQAGTIEGTLEMTVAGDGSVENATFVLADGTSFPVVGQAIGHQLAVRVKLDEQRTLVLQGVAEQPLSICQGAVDGSLIGPTEGDLGDFHAVATGQAASGATESAAASSAPAIVATSTGAVSTPTQTPPLSTPTQTPLIPTPSPTAECLPFGPAEVCGNRRCGMQDDGCGGFVDCGQDVCDGGFEVCFEGACCNYSLPCFNGMCGQMISCGEVINCNECADGKFCVDNVCCSPPGAQCFVGGECCSGSCSMLNGCN